MKGGSAAGDRPYGPLHKTRSAVMARQGMAATSQPLATAAAIRVLQKGGNAVDAAIAANAVLGVVEPMSCGLGGDLFAIVWDARSGKLYGLNASGRSPAAASLALFREKGLKEIPVHGPLSWSVPGCVDGWDRAAAEVRVALLGRATGAGDRVRGARLSRQRDHCRRLERRRPRAGRDSDLGGLLPARGTCSASGDGLPQPGTGAVAADDRRGWARRLLSRSAGQVDRELLAIGRRALRAGRFRRAHLDVGRAGVDQLPGLRHLGAAAQRPGDRGSPDAQPARAVTI